MKEYKLCPDAEKNGCPYGGASRANCTNCQDLPIWYFDEPFIDAYKLRKDKTPLNEKWPFAFVRCKKCGDVITCLIEEKNEEWVCGKCAKSTLPVKASTLETKKRIP